MKKTLYTLSGLTLLLTLALFACSKKTDNGIAPNFKEQSGTGGNPFPNNPTVTGTSTLTNPATQNSNVSGIGGAGWSNPTCVSSNSLSLKGINGTVDVTLNFALPPITGTYVIGAVPTTTQVCSMNAVNVPNEPSGIVWYAQGGVVTVITSSTSIVAYFSGIVCTQQSFNFPVVTLTGSLSCN